MNLEEIIEALNFDKEIKEAVLNKLDNEFDTIKSIAQTAYEKKDKQYNLCNEDSLTRLVVITYLLESTFDLYKKRDIPDDIIIDTFRDVSHRTNLNFRRTGKIGVSKEEVYWFSAIMLGNIFKLGSMQFEVRKMFYIKSIQDGKRELVFPKEIKKELTEDTYIINCHLQEGGDLSGEATDNAFALAREFFKKYFPDKEIKAFVGYTWLFYPAMVEHLPETSRIKEHAKRFTVVATCPCDVLALERLFPDGYSNAGKPFTSLQSMAIKHPEWFGFACGIIWF